jgi:pimeloyl-ACP methyl ester carboxylesterase
VSRFHPKGAAFVPPTIVLVHGAFAESASWDRVILHLEEAGHDVITDLVSTVDGPVVLVGHSYGGAVITNVDANAGEIAGLVYVAAFTPDHGESANALAQRFPGSTLGDALRPVPRSNGTTDLYIDREAFREQFCADVSAGEAARMASTQRPVTLEALQAPSGHRPLWKEIPSWYLVAGQDRNIPAALQHFMAYRAGARRTIEVPTASHAVAVSHPEATAHLILEAVSAVPVAA